MKRHVKCPWCLCLNTQRWGTRKVGKRKIQKIKCLSCDHTFSNRITKGKLTANGKVNIARTHLEGRTSIRQIVRDTGFAKQTIQNAIHETVKNCVDSAFIAKYLNPNWGGNLVVDGATIRVYDWSAKHFRYSKNEKRFLHKLTWIVALDLETLDIVHQYLGDEETMIDLILFFREIKNIGYPLKGLVSDGNSDIKRSTQMVFKIPFNHQLCTTHYTRGLRIRLREGKITFERYEELKKQFTKRCGFRGFLENFLLIRNLKSYPKPINKLKICFAN
ncbi:MAG: hypothetical protein HW405_774 [Candidatus Berkelbacteria bacterium]|nr:hypothetical protein [Candidatus Berkelbacteria bacterium]